jgi:WD40 repeat protein
MAIFRDEHYLVPGKPLDELIVEALEDSEHLIYLASPKAAASGWVRDELNRWCAMQDRIEDLIIVLTSGTIAFDPVTKLLDWERTDALPCSLHDRIDRLPLYIDATGLQTAATQTLDNTEFKRAINQIVAKLRGIDPIEMSGREVIQHRRNILIRNTLFLTVGIFAIVAATAAWQAILARDEAARNSTIAQARALAAKAEAGLKSKPNRSLLYALESVSEIESREDTRLAAPYEALHRAIGNVASTQFVREFNENVSALAHTPDGTTLFVGGSAGTIWRVVTSDAETEIHTIDEIQSEPAVFTLSVSTDGKWLAAACSDGALRLWDLSFPGREPTTIQVEKGWLQGASFRSGSHEIATGGDDGIIRVWNIADHLDGPITQINTGTKVTSLDFSVDDTIAYGTDKGKIALWKPSNRVVEPISIRETGSRVQDLKFSPNGQRLAAALPTSSVLLFSWPDKKAASLLSKPKLYVLRGHTHQVHTLDFSPDNSLLASSGSDHSVRLWNVNKPRLLPRVLYGHDFAVFAIAFNPKDGRLSTGDDFGVVRIWNLSSGGEPSLVTNHGNGNTALAASKTAGVVASGGADHKVAIWRFGKGAPERVAYLDLATTVHSLAFSPNGTLLFVGLADGTVMIYEMEDLSRTPSRIDAHGNIVRDLSVGTDGELFYTYSWDEDSRMWRRGEPDNPVYEFQSHSARFSPSGSWFAVGHEGRISLFNPNNLSQRLDVLIGHDDLVTRLTFSADDRLLASASEDGVVLLWDLERQPRQPHQLYAQENIVTGVALSDDGKLLATAGWERRIRLWNVDSLGEPPISLELDHEIENILFDPLTRHLIATDNVGNVLTFSTDYKELRRNACDVLPNNLLINDWVNAFGKRKPRRTCTHLRLDQSFVDAALVKAKRGDLDETILELTALKQADPGLNIDPIVDSRKAWTTGALRQAQDRAEDGRIDEAYSIMEDIKGRGDPNVSAAAAWNDICWHGGLSDNPAASKQACERAVQSNPRDGGYYDSRGLVRARVGDFDGAVEDFRFFLNWAKTQPDYKDEIEERQAWLKLLRKRQNPFDERQLAKLRFLSTQLEE